MRINEDFLDTTEDISNDISGEVTAEKDIQDFDFKIILTIGDLNAYNYAKANLPKTIFSCPQIVSSSEVIFENIKDESDFICTFGYDHRFKSAFQIFRFFVSLYKACSINLSNELRFEIDSICNNESREIYFSDIVYLIKNQYAGIKEWSNLYWVFSPILGKNIDTFASLQKLIPEDMFDIIDIFINECENIMKESDFRLAPNGHYRNYIEPMTIDLNKLQKSTLFFYLLTGYVENPNNVSSTKVQNTIDDIGSIVSTDRGFYGSYASTYKKPKLGKFILLYLGHSDYNKVKPGEQILYCLIIILNGRNKDCEKVLNSLKA